MKKDTKLQQPQKHQQWKALNGNSALNMVRTEPKMTINKTAALSWCMRATTHIVYTSIHTHANIGLKVQFLSINRWQTSSFCLFISFLFIIIFSCCCHCYCKVRACVCFFLFFSFEMACCSFNCLLSQYIDIISYVAQQHKKYYVWVLYVFNFSSSSKHQKSFFSHSPCVSVCLTCNNYILCYRHLLLGGERACCIVMAFL